MPPGQFRAVVGRNDFVESFHDDVSNYLIWRNREKPRQCPTSENIKLSRAMLKRAYIECVRNEDNLKADSLANNCNDTTYITFWKNINSHHLIKSPLANTVNGCNGQTDITKMWIT